MLNLLRFRDAADYEAHPHLAPNHDISGRAMIVRNTSLDAFLGMASDPAYMAGIGHRKAALEDSRLLPILDRTASVS